MGRPGTSCTVGLSKRGTIGNARHMLPESIVVTNRCPFCSSATVVASTPSALALRDAFALSEGYTLVMPRRHVASLFELTVEEQVEVWQLVARVRADLIEEFHPGAFNIGVNDGEAAGQIVDARSLYNPTYPPLLR